MSDEVKAFPLHVPGSEDEKWEGLLNTGMDLRDLFAIQIAAAAVQGACARDNKKIFQSDSKIKTAKFAYNMADHLMKERGRRSNEG